MTLREKLAEHKQAFLSKASPEAVALVKRVEDDLRASGILDRILKEGDRAPEFALADTEGRVLSSQDALARGPLVVSFYRGVW